MLRDVGGNPIARRVELALRHLTVEIAIEPQEEIELVERQPQHDSHGASIDRDLRGADAGCRRPGHRDRQQHADGAHETPDYNQRACSMD